ncbi:MULTISPECIES: serine/threonine protein kinase [unclassified Streptomyces]|uniref:serine/threonine protein kinase n=1 Tax=unclassified Streptomyces TaxID=2593676 RepID=UPI002E7FC3AE|nr:serine/threonine protein kinase [Streptomyces sp. NBC_00589]WTI39005.1 serine/threonine protein kinase [Streptomyces sp. NBC_00775]WUB33024.1 serine/threonine protein kinase [Streptomyces sp. NBC_00589]
MVLHPLLGVDEVPAVEPYLGRVGEVFKVFREQDSGCVSYGVRLLDGARWFVKASVNDRARRSLDRGWAFHRAVRHSAIVPQVHRIAVRGGGGWAVVMPWREGEVLYHATVDGPRDRTSPGSPMARFRALPAARVLRAFDRVLDAHLAVEAAGHVAVDFYDGALLYDFAADTAHLIDLDEYRPGPFEVEDERLPGSRRFMAPEEFVRGAVIDTRTTVFTLGRTARLLLDAGDEERAWRGTPQQLAVVERATFPDPDDRFADVHRFAAAWRAANEPQET